MSAPKFQLKLARAARTDLTHILAFTLKTWGEAQRALYQTKLDEALSTITNNPQLGRERYGLFVLAAGRHRIFYRVEDTTVYVVRILHDRMDAERHLPQP